MTSPRTLCLVAAVAVLAAGLAVFQAGFNDYADASVDRISAVNHPELLNDAMWMQRHAVITMHDSVFIIAGALVLFVVAGYMREEDHAND